MQKAQALVQSQILAQAITTSSCYWALIDGGCQKKGRDYTWWEKGTD